MKNDSFEVGDIVTPIKSIKFMDGTFHLVGIKYEIKEGEVSYYNVCGKDYILLESMS